MKFLSEPDRWRISSGPNAWMLTIAPPDFEPGVMVQGVLRHWGIDVQRMRCTHPFEADLFSLPVLEQRLDLVLLCQPELSLRETTRLAGLLVNALRPGGQLIIFEDRPMAKRGRSVSLVGGFHNLGLQRVRLVPMTGRLRKCPELIRHPLLAWASPLWTGRYAVSGFRPTNNAIRLAQSKRSRVSKPVVGSAATLRSLRNKETSG